MRIHFAKNNIECGALLHAFGFFYQIVFKGSIGKCHEISARGT
jgi:hypothetical protein